MTQVDHFGDVDLGDGHVAGSSGRVTALGTLRSGEEFVHEAEDRAQFTYRAPEIKMRGAADGPSVAASILLEQTSAATPMEYGFAYTSDQGRLDVVTPSQVRLVPSGRDDGAVGGGETSTLRADSLDNSASVAQVARKVLRNRFCAHTHLGHLQTAECIDNQAVGDLTSSGTRDLGGKGGTLREKSTHGCWQGGGNVLRAEDATLDLGNLGAGGDGRQGATVEVANLEVQGNSQTKIFVSGQGDTTLTGCCLGGQVAVTAETGHARVSHSTIGADLEVCGKTGTYVVHNHIAGNERIGYQNLLNGQIERSRVTEFSDNINTASAAKKTTLAGEQLITGGNQHYDHGGEVHRIAGSIHEPQDFDSLSAAARDVVECHGAENGVIGDTHLQEQGYERFYENHYYLDADGNATAQWESDEARAATRADQQTAQEIHHAVNASGGKVLFKSLGTRFARLSGNVALAASLSVPGVHLIAQGNDFAVGQHQTLQAASVTSLAENNRVAGEVRGTTVELRGNVVVEQSGKIVARQFQLGDENSQQVEVAGELAGECGGLHSRRVVTGTSAQLEADGLLEIRGSCLDLAGSRRAADLIEQGSEVIHRAGIKTAVASSGRWETCAERYRGESGGVANLGADASWTLRASEADVASCLRGEGGSAVYVVAKSLRTGKEAVLDVGTLQVAAQSLRNLGVLAGRDRLKVSGLEQGRGCESFDNRGQLKGGTVAVMVADQLENTGLIEASVVEIAQQDQAPQTLAQLGQVEAGRQLLIRGSIDSELLLKLLEGACPGVRAGSLEVVQLQPAVVVNRDLRLGQNTGLHCGDLEIAPNVTLTTQNLQVRAAGDVIQHLGSEIRGEGNAAIVLQAGRHFVQGVSKDSEAWRTARQARIQTGGDLHIEAGEDLISVGGVLVSEAGKLVLRSGRHIIIIPIAYSDEWQSEEKNWLGTRKTVFLNWAERERRAVLASAQGTEVHAGEADGSLLHNVDVSGSLRLRTPGIGHSEQPLQEGRHRLGKVLTRGGNHLSLFARVATSVALGVALGPLGAAAGAAVFNTALDVAIPKICVMKTLTNTRWRGATASSPWPVLAPQLWESAQVGASEELPGQVPPRRG